MALADSGRNHVENVSEIASGLLLHDNRGDKDVNVFGGYALGETFEGGGHSVAQGNLLYHAGELGSGRFRRLAGHELQRLVEAEASTHGACEYRQVVG